MLTHSPFYNKTIKNITAAFGALFNDISIVRSNANGSKTQTVKVPLTYASADKAFSRRTEDPTLNFNMQGVFPKLAFYLSGISYDPVRKICNLQHSSVNGQMMYAPAPYNLEFELYLASANIEDGLQVVEQILPFFNPEFTLNATMVPTIGLKSDVPIILNSVSYTDPAPDSNYEDFRIIEWTLSFTAKVSIYGPTSVKKEIKQSTLNLFDRLPFSDLSGNLEDFVASVVPSNANETDPHTITEVIVKQNS